jgi:shikimate kinase
MNIPIVFYLIGPSSVGKSSAGEWITKYYPEYTYIDFDDTVKPYHGIWEKCRPLLVDIERQSIISNQNIIVALGAGTQLIPEMVGFLTEQNRSGAVVLITADAHEAWNRNEEKHRMGRSFEDYYRCEYLDREKIYSVAAISIDVSGLSAPDAAAEVYKSIRRIAETQVKAE